MAVALLAFTATPSAQAEDVSKAPLAAAATPAYFEMRDITRETFVIQLTDAARIQEARNIVADGDTKIVTGRIVKSSADYNRPWSFHYNPDTITFENNVFEVCDATIPYVEEHLDEAGGAFLPGLYWCPWTGTLTAEVTL